MSDDLIHGGGAASLVGVAAWVWKQAMVIGKLVQGHKDLARRIEASEASAARTDEQILDRLSRIESLLMERKK